jgi:hypothetical protein
MSSVSIVATHSFLSVSIKISTISNGKTPKLQCFVFPQFSHHFSFVFKQCRLKFSSRFQTNLENHNPQVIRQVSKEVKQLLTENLEGIKIQINESNFTDINVILTGPGEISLIFSQGKWKTLLLLAINQTAN